MIRNIINKPFFKYKKFNDLQINYKYKLPNIPKIPDYVIIVNESSR